VRRSIVKEAAKQVSEIVRGICRYCKGEVDVWVEDGRVILAHHNVCGASCLGSGKSPVLYNI
jgi:hypothetical protein